MFIKSFIDQQLGAKWLMIARLEAARLNDDGLDRESTKLTKWKKNIKKTFSSFSICYISSSSSTRTLFHWTFFHLRTDRDKIKAISGSNCYDVSNLIAPGPHTDPGGGGTNPFHVISYVPKEIYIERKWSEKLIKTRTLEPWFHGDTPFAHVCLPACRTLTFIVLLPALLIFI